MSNEYLDWIADRNENLKLANERGDRFCSDMCKMMYFEKYTLDEFWEELQESWPEFKKNMEHLHGKEFALYPEEMMGLFGAWMEME